MFSIIVIGILRQTKQIHQHRDICLLFIGGFDCILNGPLVPPENGLKTETQTEARATFANPPKCPGVVHQKVSVAVTFKYFINYFKCLLNSFHFLTVIIRT